MADVPTVAPPGKTATAPGTPAKKAPPPPEMRPDDEMAAKAPTLAPGSRMPQQTADVPPPSEGGFLEKFWDGVNNVVTLGGLIGGQKQEDRDLNPEFDAQGRRLENPANRFASKPAAPKPESDSAAGRMVDRMTGMVGGDQPKENEFGLPEGPVVPPLESAPGMVEVEPSPPGMQMVAERSNWKSPAWDHTVAPSTSNASEPSPYAQQMPSPNMSSTLSRYLRPRQSCGIAWV